MRKSKGDWSWLRDDFNVSQLAQMLGIKRQVIDNWVRGRNDPDLLSTLKLARLVGSSEELERRANIKLEFTPPESIKSYVSLGALTDRNYGYLIKVSDHLKYIGQFGKLHQRAYAALKEVAGKDNLFTARLWFDIGYAELMLGHPLDAVESARKARELLPQKEDSMLLADTHWFAGECLRVIGKLNESYPHLDEAAKIYKRLEAKPSFYEPGPVWLEWDLGRYFAAYGRYDTALNHFQHMEDTAKDIWLAEAEVIAAWSLGNIADIKGEFDSAISSYAYAKELAAIVGDRYWEAAALWSIAEVYRKIGEFDKAITTAEAVHKTFELIGNMRMVAKANYILAACYLQKRELDKASELYLGAIDVFVKTDDISMEQRILVGLALIDLAYESQKPIPDYRKPLGTFLEIDADRPNIHDLYLDVYQDLACAEALRLSGYTERALTRFHTVIKTCSLNGYQLETAHALLGIAATKLLEGEADRQSCVEAHKIYQKTGSKWGQIQAFIIQALIESQMGESNTHLLQEGAILANEISLRAESQLIEVLAMQSSAQRANQVLLFVPAIA